MIPLPRPVSALFNRANDGDWLPVAIIAMDDEEYLAVDEHGQTTVGIHYLFVIVDGEVRDAVYRARNANGS